MQTRTDNTRSRDVFPAFSSPIIVTSISLALPMAISLQRVRAHGACEGDHGREWDRDAILALRLQVNLPEGPEQPVVYLPK